MPFSSKLLKFGRPPLLAQIRLQYSVQCRREHFSRACCKNDPVRRADPEPSARSFRRSIWLMKLSTHQREQPPPAEQQQDGEAVDKSADGGEQHQGRLVAKHCHLREIDVCESRGEP